MFNVSWLVGCFGFNGPLRQYFSLYRAVSQREGERGERIDESENVQTTPTRTYCKRIRPLPYCNQNCRTPRHWKFTQHHRTTRPPLFNVRLAGGHLYGKQLFTWLSLVVSFMAYFVLSLFPLDVLDGIWDLIESVSEGFLTYSFYTMWNSVYDFSYLKIAVNSGM